MKYGEAFLNAGTVSHSLPDLCLNNHLLSSGVYYIKYKQSSSTVSSADIPTVATGGKVAILGGEKTIMKPR